MQTIKTLRSGWWERPKGWRNGWRKRKTWRLTNIFCTKRRMSLQPNDHVESKHSHNPTAWNHWNHRAWPCKSSHTLLFSAGLLESSSRKRKRPTNKKNTKGKEDRKCSKTEYVFLQQEQCLIFFCLEKIDCAAVGDDVDKTLSETSVWLSTLISCQQAHRFCTLSDIIRRNLQEAAHRFKIIFYVCVALFCGPKGTAHQNGRAYKYSLSRIGSWDLNKDDRKSFHVPSGHRWRSNRCSPVDEKKRQTHGGVEVDNNDAVWWNKRGSCQCGRHQGPWQTGHLPVKWIMRSNRNNISTVVSIVTAPQHARADVDSIKLYIVVAMEMFGQQNKADRDIKYSKSQEKKSKKFEAHPTMPRSNGYCSSAYRCHLRYVYACKCNAQRWVKFQLMQCNATMWGDCPGSGSSRKTAAEKARFGRVSISICREVQAQTQVYALTMHGRCCYARSRLQRWWRLDRYTTCRHQMGNCFDIKTSRVGVV